MTTAVDSFGASLRWWRTTRRFSQLDLASAAEVSSRHLSFLETGKAHPSREMVIHLATVLDVPLRDRNRLLHAAGFAPAYSEQDLDTPEMDDVRRVLSWILDAHAPNPALVVDRRGDLVDANRAAFRLMSELVDEHSPALAAPLNSHRIVLHPDGIRARTANWPEVAANLLQRMEREQAHRPADEALGALLEEVVAYPDVAPLRRQAELPTGADLLVTLRATTRSGDRLQLVTTLATIGAPYDVTLDELRLETFFPGDEATGELLRAWADAEPLPDACRT
ncbi:MAG: helix-turn-helix transcriptional regulator [Actinomycetota bacterium]